jgi:hypothetical protein
MRKIAQFFVAFSENLNLTKKFEIQINYAYRSGKDVPYKLSDNLELGLLKTTFQSVIQDLFSSLLARLE